MGGYVLYYLVVIVADLLNRKNASADEEDTELIGIDDMLQSKKFTPKKMELSESVRQEYLGKSGHETETYRPQRVTGAIFAQGFELDNYNARLMRSGTAVFDGPIKTY